MDCVKSSNANHVIQRIVSLPEPALDFVQAFTGRVFELSTHPYGCRVLQRCFEFLPAEQSRPLLDEMHTQTRRLVLDQFGNYGKSFFWIFHDPHGQADALARRSLSLSLSQSSNLSSIRVCRRTAQGSSKR